MHNAVKAFAEKHLAEVSKTTSVLAVGAKIASGQHNLQPQIRALKTDMDLGNGVDEICLAENLIDKYGQESFDHVFSIDALEHMENWQSAIHNMWGVLKTGGMLVLTMAAEKNGYHGHPHDYVRMSFDELRRIFNGHPIIDTVEGQISFGVAVKKTGPLITDLSTIETSTPRK